MPIALPFYNPINMWQLREHKEAMSGGRMTEPRVYEWVSFNVFVLKKVHKHWPDD